jgi:hypothetical protein
MRNVESRGAPRRAISGPSYATMAALLTLAALLFGARSLRAQSVPATVTAPSSSSADSASAPPYPVRLLDRPTTLPKGALRLDLYGLGTHTPGSSFATTGILGGGWGLTRNLEVGGQFVPVTLSPTVQYTNPSLYATYQHSLSSSVALAPTLQAVFPLRSGDPFTIDAGASLYVNLGEWGYLAASPTFSLNTREEGNGTSLSLPLTVMRQASTRFNWQLSTAVGFSRFDPRFGLSRRFEALDFNDVTIPATALLMYTVERKGTGDALVDIIAQVQFSQLYTRRPELRGWQTDDWTLQLQTSWYIVKSPRNAAP